MSKIIKSICSLKNLPLFQLLLFVKEFTFISVIILSRYTYIPQLNTSWPEKQAELSMLLGCGKLCTMSSVFGIFNRFYQPPLLNLFEPINGMQCVVHKQNRLTIAQFRKVLQESKRKIAAKRQHENSDGHTRNPRVPSENHNRKASAKKPKWCFFKAKGEKACLPSAKPFIFSAGEDDSKVEYDDAQMWKSDMDVI